MNLQSQLAISDEIHSIDSVLRAIKPSPGIEESQSQFYRLKTALWRGDDLQRPEVVFAPFLSLLKAVVGNDSLCGEILGSLSRIAQHSFCSDCLRGDFIINALLDITDLLRSSVAKCLFRVCSLVCIHGKCSPRVALRALTALVDSETLSQQPEAADVAAMARSVAGACLDEPEPLLDLLMNRARGKPSPQRALALKLMLGLCEAHREICDWLRPLACALLMGAFRTSESCGFVTTLRLFFAAFSDSWSGSLLSFSRCISSAVSFVKSGAKDELRDDVFELIVDFVAIPGFIRRFFANTTGRNAIPCLVDSIFELIFSVAGSKSPLPRSRPLAIAAVSSVVAQLSDFGKGSAEPVDFSAENEKIQRLEEFKRTIEANPNKFPVDSTRAEHIAKAIVSSGVSPSALGVFFSRQDEGIINVLDAFLRRVLKRRNGFDASVRIFITAVRFPGEGQILDRAFERFADVYFSLHECKYFADREAVHVLSYAWLMLHTSLHNTAITNKQTEKTFKNMLRGANAGSDFDDAYLSEVYFRVKNFPVPVDDELILCTHQHWELVDVRASCIGLTICNGDEEGVTDTIFEKVWTEAAPIFHGLFEKGSSAALSSFENSVIIASTLHNSHVVDNILKTFCAVAINSTNTSRGMAALEFVFTVAVKYGYAIGNWVSIAGVVLHLFSISALPNDLTTQKWIYSDKMIKFTADMFGGKKKDIEDEVRMKIIKHVKPESLPKATSSFPSQSVDSLLEGFQTCIDDSTARRLFIVHFCCLVVHENSFRCNEFNSLVVAQIISSYAIKTENSKALGLMLNCVFSLLDVVSPSFIFGEELIRIASNKVLIAEIPNLENNISFYIKNHGYNIDLFHLVGCPKSSEMIWETYKALSEKFGDKLGPCAFIAASSETESPQIERLREIVSKIDNKNAAKSFVNEIMPPCLIANKTKTAMIDMAFQIVEKYPEEVTQNGNFESMWFKALNFAAKNKIYVVSMKKAAEHLIEILSEKDSFIEKTGKIVADIRREFDPDNVDKTAKNQNGYSKTSLITSFIKGMV